MYTGLLYSALDRENYLQAAATRIRETKFYIQVTMNTMSRLARQLVGTRTPHTIKVRVIEKEEMYTSTQGNCLEYQIITFEDQEGAKLKTILHNEELVMFQGVIQDEMENEINNIEIQVSADEILESPEQPVYYISINSKTTIQPVYGPNSTSSPEYILLASIPREPSLDERYNVLGIVVYVGQKYEVLRHNRNPWDVIDIFIIDQSSEQMVIVTVWGEATINICRTLQITAHNFPMIGITALMTSYQKGFSLATTHLTFINLNPQGEDAAALRDWGEANKELLAAKHQHICEVRCPETQRFITTIQTLLQKKDTLQEEHHWLRVQLKDFDHKKVRFYLGCSECGTGNNEDFGVGYICTECFTEKAISTPRMAVTFEATDETGAYFFTALTQNAEKLLEVNATTLYCMLPQEREDYLGQIGRQIRNAHIYIQVIPTKSLSRTQVMGWILKQLSLT
ncbi:replication protein A 70 kDa DNA-binding subunit B-like [Silene latifolia]|uniref:replication protein A 70 kDa DNA-binding subunit B-like n=1 Tax=Silene latifolia TaxID=37657 RepID=UPI003D78946B